MQNKLIDRLCEAHLHIPASVLSGLLNAVYFLNSCQDPAIGALK